METKHSTRSSSGQNSCRLRRRSADVLRGRLPMKSSPYVGWFRHAPSTMSPDRWSHRPRSFSFNGGLIRKRNVTEIFAPVSPNMKTSPYIGWFRHAPPSRLQLKKRQCSDTVAALTLVDATLRSEKYLKTPIHEDLRGFLKQMKEKDPKEFVSGRLPGGSPLHEDCGSSIGNANDSHKHECHNAFPPLRWIDTKMSDSLEQSMLQGLMGDDASCCSTSTPDDGSGTTTSATLSMLTKLASWFLYPLAHDANSCGYRDYDDAMCTRMGGGVMTLMFPYLAPLFRRVLLLENGVNRRLLLQQGRQQESSETNNIPESEDGDLEDSEEDEYSDYSGHIHEHNKNNPSSTPSSPLDISVSSLAQAYYAYQASREIIEQEDLGASGGSQSSIPPDDNHHRFDYVITQMDIARMVRNASRHLDVESILKLPTVTYRNADRTAQRDDVRDREEMSNENGTRLEVEEEVATSEDHISAVAADGGWSWMIVPPNPECSIDHEESHGCHAERAEQTVVPSAEHGEQEENDDDQREFCVICLEHFRDGDRLRVLPCQHLFHIGCIDKWLSGTCSDEECFTSGCPTCKKRPLDFPYHSDVFEEDEIGQRGEEGSAPNSPDGSVPSWAFARLGGVLAKETESMSNSC